MAKMWGSDQIFGHNDERGFADDVLGKDPLTRAVAYIANNLEPSDVFSPQALIGWIAEFSTPAEVFNKNELRKWAKTHGYVLKEEQEEESESEDYPGE